MEFRIENGSDEKKEEDGGRMRIFRNSESLGPPPPIMDV